MIFETAIIISKDNYGQIWEKTMMIGRLGHNVTQKIYSIFVQLNYIAKLCSSEHDDDQKIDQARF